MAHEFESGFFVHQPAWHGLGTVLDDAPNIETAIIKAGLDWKVLERPLFTDNQEFDDPNVLTPSANASRIYTHKAIVRETDSSVLGVVGKTYTPVQNDEAFNFFDEILNSGAATLEAGGSLRNGQKIWILAKMKAEGEVLKGDEVQSHLLLSNSHDGMMSLWIQFTPIRVVCMNTLSAALASRHNDYAIGKAIRLKHAPSVTEGLKIAKTLMNTSTQTFSVSMEAYKMFASVPLDDKGFKKYVDSIFRVNPASPEVDMEKVLDEEPKRISKRDELLFSLFESGAGSDIKGVKGTLWAGYNAITEWVDHYRGYGGQEGRLDTSWFGEGTVVRNKAFVEAIKVAKAA